MQKMECVDRRIKKERKHPRVPIKTYKWEDVKRSRRKGGYPWTHLYKEPFYELLDPEPFTMDGMRKAKSSSTMGKSDDLDISEVSTFYDNQSSYMVEDVEIPIKTKETQNHSIKTSCSSLILDEEQCDDSDEKETETAKADSKDIEHLSPGMFFLHSEESLDNISQYLEKEERGPQAKQNKKKTEEMLKPEDDEGTSRKRKLSADSGRSKVSLGKQALLRKLKDTKEKIKIPKISFSTKLKKPMNKHKSSPSEVKKPVKNSSPKDSKPLYIHIPLKPTTGETDEYSHLENETTTDQKSFKKPASFKDLVKTLKNLQEPKIDHKGPSPIKETIDEEAYESTAAKELSQTSENTEEIPKSATENILLESKETATKKETNENYDTNPVEENNEEFKIDDDIEIIEIEGEMEIQNDESTTPDNDMFDKLFEASTSRPRTESQNFGRKTRSKSAEPEHKRKLSLESSYSRKSLSKLGLLKKLRDAKDKVKSKFSKTTSKKEINPIEPEKDKPKPNMSKHHQKGAEPMYIHIPLKPPEGTTDEYSHLEKKATSIQEKTETVPSTPDSPEDTPGNVQFIILTAPSDDELLDYNSSDVPETPSSESKIFFVNKVHELKELAKGAVNEITGDSQKLAPVTEEPGSAKSSMEDIRKKLVDEETKIAKKIETSCVEDIIKTVLEEKKEQEKTGAKHMTVDEEDGLSENKQQEDINKPENIKIFVEDKIEIVKADEQNKNENIEELDKKFVEDVKLEMEEILNLEEADIEPDEQVELKSVLKGPNSPVMKKKVSFKRKKKNKSYEEISIPTSEAEEVTIIEAQDKFQSMPVDEEEMYMEEKMFSEPSSEEKRNRWSKISDHEYEPVNPLPDNVEIIPPPSVTLNNSSVCIIDTAQALKGPEPLNYTVNENESSINPNEKSPKAQRVIFSATTDSRSSESDRKPKDPNKFQAAFKQKADNFKHKLQNIKRPHINLPDTSKFQRPKFHKPNLQKFKIEKKFSMPKIPDTAKIHLPSFSLPRKKTIKRNSSTESNAGDSKKPIFDFGTYPRIFKRKSTSDQKASDFATVPRTKQSDSRTTEDSKDSRQSASDSIRIPLHSENSIEKSDSNTIELPSDDRQSSHVRYEEGIDSEDECDRENRELIDERDFLSRWQRGRFNPDEFMEEPQPSTKITDLDSPDDKGYEFSPSTEQRYSSGSSLGVHRQGVIEEINPDEFFLRQKGISQDNIEVGMYLSTEIREAFRNPTNALAQMEDLNNFNIQGSHTSLPEMAPNKKKSIKKPKRKKTPHASQEQINYGEEETADEDTFLPPRPQRRSRRKKKTNKDVVPYQETIRVDSEEERIAQHRESIDIFADDEREIMYENELMQGKDYPDIKIINPYKNYGYEEEEDTSEEFVPEAPPRRQKSLKSLSTYENDTIQRLAPKMQQAFFERRVTEPNIISCKEDIVIPERKSYHMNITEQGIKNTDYLEPYDYNINIEGSLETYRFMDDDFDDIIIPEAPPRKQKSVKSLTISENESLPGSLSANRAVFNSEKDLEEPMIDAIRTESKVIIPIDTDFKQPKRPLRSRGNSQSRSASQKELDSLSMYTDSLAAEEPVACVEEPFIRKTCDYMGYSVVDKSKIRDPPLPPPRSLRRKKRSTKEKENNFFTVPRSKSSKGTDKDTPVRPLRNYSTLGPPRLSVTPDIVEDKENVNIMQYIEMDDEPNKDLQSGEVIEKMKARPLPAPPRPPRKTRPLHDVTSMENIMVNSTEDLPKEATGETEVYTQTEPLPDDFECEEVFQEPTDKIIIPTQSTNAPKIETRLITPTSYIYEETITHGSLLVEPLNGAKILPDSDFTQVPTERIVPVRVDEDFDETSSIPEDFHNLAEPKIPPQPFTGEVDILKAQKLQVVDLDVDTLTVNKLLAGKIIVSEIDSSSIQTNQISSKSGALKVDEISLPPETLSQILKTIQDSQVLEERRKDEDGEQKKTSIEFRSNVEISPLPEYNVDSHLAVPETLEEQEKLPDEVFVEDLKVSEENPLEVSTTVHSEQEVSESLVKEISQPATLPLEDSKMVLEESLTSEETKVCTELISKERTIFKPLEDTQDVISTNMIPIPSVETEDIPPLVPLRANAQDAKSDSEINLSQQEKTAPHRPPRQSEKMKTPQSLNVEPAQEPEIDDEPAQEPEIDDEPPPRPPQPPMGYIPSQPPTSFYALRAQKYVDDNIPTVPRRRRQAKSKQLTRSSSEESSEVSLMFRRHQRRSSEPTIAQLSGQLARACGSEANNQLKRLITYILNNVLRNEDRKQDLNVMIIIILVLIAGLLLLGYGEERTVVHLHHWEYFNPPKNL